MKVTADKISGFRMVESFDDDLKIIEGHEIIDAADTEQSFDSYGSDILGAEIDEDEAEKIEFFYGIQ